MTTSTKVSTLSSSARRALRAAAHHLDPVVMMGQHGLTAAVLHEIDLALTAHALIKVRAGSDEREIRDGYLTEICEKLACESVQHLGKLFVLWRNADGAGNADKSAEQDAAAIKASNDPHVEKERGPRSKLPSERAAERANSGSAAPAARSGGYASRGGTPSGGRGAPVGGRGAPAAAGRDNAAGPRWRYGETPPDAPRREGWAPKDRRGAARFGAAEGGDDSRRRDGPPSYGAPRGRAPGGYAGSSGSSGASGAGGGGGGGGGAGYRGAAPAGGRSRYGGNTSGGNYGGDNRGGTGGGGSSYGGRGGSSSYGGGQGDGAPRARWGERREPSQGGGGGGGFANGGNSGSGGNSGGGNFGNDRGAPAPRSTYSRGNDAGGSDRAPRSGGGGGGGWGNRDGVTGKPSGFSRGGGAGGAGGAAPRARRRFG